MFKVSRYSKSGEKSRKFVKYVNNTTVYCWCYDATFAKLNNQTIS